VVLVLVLKLCRVHAVGPWPERLNLTALGEQVTAMNMKITVLWDVTLCGFVVMEAPSCLPPQMKLGSLIIHPAVQLLH
jgi:hypothetical protein